MNRYLIESALRVLAHKVGGTQPLPQDAEMLKKNALPEEANLDTERIACQVVAREMGKHYRDQSRR